MRELIQKQLEAGADICKVVTTAQKFEDNLAVLQLIADFPKARVVAFAMGPLGFTSRIMCPLVGGDFIYASIETGKEAAPGQIAVGDLRKIYTMVEG
jgi:3-dehydroquinate dehydratase type I